MKDLAYQQEKIKELCDKIVELLNDNLSRQKIVFKAPTGSGKTYMTAMAMESAADALLNNQCREFERVAYIWIAPNRLHSQAYDSLSKLFAETRALHPVMFDNITSKALNHGDVLCLNWGSIHSADNIMVRETETGRNLWNVLEHTRRQRTAIVVIVDEEHLHWDGTADCAAEVLDRINPIVEVRVSATPKTNSVHTVLVKRKDVVEAQMIKEGIVINPDISVRDGVELDNYLIDEALKKRNQLAKSYRELGKNINPLLLIQLPNDGPTISTEDKTKRDNVVNYLRENYAISVESGELAIWLSDKSNKQNLEGIEKNDSSVKVLIFKEAIAKGWDCPRAAVLLIFRRLQSNEFAIQTLGRILRMPEQHYYEKQELNKGYVYTTLSCDRIVVAGETEDYWKAQIIPSNRRENLKNVTLPSVYEFYAASDRNRLGPDFTQFLYEYVKEYWLDGATQRALFDIDENGNMRIAEEVSDVDSSSATNRHIIESNIHIRFNVRGLILRIPKNINLNGEEEEIVINDSIEYSRTYSKIRLAFLEYCRSLLTKYEKSAGTPVLASAIVDVMERLFDISEYETPKIVMSDRPVDNMSKFTDLLTRALDEYYKIVETRKSIARERSFTPWTWEVPESRTYNADTNTRIDDVENHALTPFARQNNASDQEKRFEEFLEQNSEYIDWWYKNGDNGRMHYAIEYINPERRMKMPFYVDFIIRLKNGDIYLFDTKGSDISRDIETESVLVAKHNALHKYVCDNDNPKLKQGSILKFRGGAWRYSPDEISSTNTDNWYSFFPDQLV